jgi:hypothetical protein
MLTKSKVIETLGAFPDKFTVDELLDKVMLIDKIEKGDMQSQQNATVSEEELEKEMNKWFK